MTRNSVRPALLSFFCPSELPDLTRLFSHDNFDTRECVYIYIYKYNYIYIYISQRRLRLSQLAHCQGRLDKAGKSLDSYHVHNHLGNDRREHLPSLKKSSTLMPWLCRYWALLPCQEGTLAALAQLELARLS